MQIRDQAEGKQATISQRVNKRCPKVTRKDLQR